MTPRASILLVVAAVAVLSVFAATPTENGILVTLDDGGQVELAAHGFKHFRISVTYNGQAPVPLASPMIVDQASHANFTRFEDGEYSGIEVDNVGSVALKPNGEFIMKKYAASPLATSSRLFVFRPQGSPKLQDVCQAVFPLLDAADGSRTDMYPDGLNVADEGTCCAKCNEDPQCTFWVWSPVGPDMFNKNCWALKNVNSVYQNGNRVSGGSYKSALPVVQLQLQVSSDAQFTGSGTGGEDAQQLFKSSGGVFVANTALRTPHHFNTDGYSTLVVADTPFLQEAKHVYPVSWDSSPRGWQKRYVRWSAALVNQADFYLSPTRSASGAVTAMWALTGLPKMPPRYAFGFQASRWGWKDKDYIDDVLIKFRTQNYPIDAFILDFEWYTSWNDYALPLDGSPDFVDFSYNNITFPTPVAQLKSYHDKFKVRFGGIRKPRLGNSKLLQEAHSKNWVVEGTRDLNYSLPEVRKWYADKLAPFISDGVDYWWNDEGESFYHLFHYWNLAQLELLRSQQSPDLKDKRFYSISRSYTPGVQSLGGTAIWTGDVTGTWQSLQDTPGYMLNWILSGAPYITCDIGGFSGPDASPELVVRWYQVGVLMPMMRVHSHESNVPHFPFFYDKPYANAMGAAMRLRYALLPYLYSIALDASDPETPNQAPIHPLFTEFAEDPNVATMTSQWMYGNIMSAPVLSPGGNADVYFPKVTHGDYTPFFYKFNSTETFVPGTTMKYRNLNLTELPLFVLDKSIIPIANNLASTHDINSNATLEVQVYATRTNTTTATIAYFSEDDGATEAYSRNTQAEPTVRSTMMKFSQGPPGHNDIFTFQITSNPQIRDPSYFGFLKLVVFYPNGKIVRMASVPFTDQGTIPIPKSV